MPCFVLHDYFRLSSVCFRFLIVSAFVFCQLFDHLNLIWVLYCFLYYIVLLLYLVLYCFLENAIVVNSSQSNAFFVDLYSLTFMYTHLTASLIRVSNFEIWLIWPFLFFCIFWDSSVLILFSIYCTFHNRSGSALHDVDGVNFKHLWSLMVFSFPKCYCIVRLSHCFYVWYTKLFLETLLCSRFVLRFVLYLDEYWGFSSRKTLLWLFSGYITQ